MQKVALRRLVEVVGVDPCWVGVCDFTGVGFGFLGSWGICGCSLGIGAVAFGGWRFWCGPISGCMLKCGSLARREGLGSECRSWHGMKCWSLCVWVMVFFSMGDTGVEWNKLRVCRLGWCSLDGKGIGWWSHGDLGMNHWSLFSLQCIPLPFSPMLSFPLLLILNHDKRKQINLYLNS